MGNNTATAHVVSQTGHVCRVVEVTSFEEALELHRRWPKCDIGLFLGGDPDGEMWCYWPEMDDSRPRYRDRW